MPDSWQIQPVQILFHSEHDMCVQDNAMLWSPMSCYQLIRCSSIIQPHVWNLWVSWPLCYSAVFWICMEDVHAVKSPCLLLQILLFFAGINGSTKWLNSKFKSCISSSGFIWIICHKSLVSCKFESWMIFIKIWTFVYPCPCIIAWTIGCIVSPFCQPNLM